MESLGEYLKREREERKVTLEEIARVTRIRKDFLSALERDDYQLFPAPIYVHGFLKTYARYLGLDVDEVLSRCRSQLAARAEEEPAKIPGISPASRQWPVPLAFLLIVAFVAMGFYFSSGRQGLKEVAKEPARAMPIVAAPLEPGAVPAPEPLSENYIPEKRHELIVKASASSWVSVQADSEAPQQIALKAGETVMLSAKNRFHLVVGSPEVVEIAFDGQPVKIPGETTELILPQRGD